MPELMFLILKALYWLVIADALMSWVMPEDQFPRTLTKSITDPLYAPIRAILGPEKTGGIDISPILVILLLSVMQRMLVNGV